MRKIIACTLIITIIVSGVSTLYLILDQPFGEIWETTYRSHVENITHKFIFTGIIAFLILLLMLMFCPEENEEPQVSAQVS